MELKCVFFPNVINWVLTRLTGIIWTRYRNDPDAEQMRPHRHIRLQVNIPGMDVNVYRNFTDGPHEETRSL